MDDKILREHLRMLLHGHEAHADWTAALKDLPEQLRAVKPPGAPHSAWELLEHARIAQRDILEFSRNPKHVSPDWPSGYWPKASAPPSAMAWEKGAKSFQKDLESMVKLVTDPEADLAAKIPHGSGQTILREALLVADHNSYHLGQLIQLRRLLGCWPET
ncbi:MAG: DinB family protein [Candidatus Acidiferrales bacterium]